MKDTQGVLAKIQSLLVLTEQNLVALLVATFTGNATMAHHSAFSMCRIYGGNESECSTYIALHCRL